eukprot:3533236-Rhodomonas_salina.1
MSGKSRGERSRHFSLISGIEGGGRGAVGEAKTQADTHSETNCENACLGHEERRLCAFLLLLSGSCYWFGGSCYSFQGRAGHWFSGARYLGFHRKRAGRTRPAARHAADRSADPRPIDPEGQRLG